MKGSLLMMVVVIWEGCYWFVCLMIIVVIVIFVGDMSIFIERIFWFVVYISFRVWGVI